MDKFDEIKSPLLKVFNRTIMANNIFEDYGMAPAQEYLDQFNSVDKDNIRKMAQLLKTKGYEYVKRFVRENTVFEEDLTPNEFA